MEGTCNHEGCSQQVRARGYCFTHYQAWRRNRSDADAIKCSVDDCKKAVSTRGFCNNHYSVFLRRGTTDPIPSKRKTLLCSVVGCGRPYYNVGFCVRHNSKRYNYGDPLAAAGPETKVGRHEAGLDRIQKILNGYSLPSTKSPQAGCSYDLLVSENWRIEFKIGNGKPFNLHRHNIPFDASKVDFLWLRNEADDKDYIVPSAPFHGTLTQPINKKLRRYRMPIDALVSILRIVRK